MSERSALPPLKYAKGERLGVLDAFRALAILSVILFHLLHLGERSTNSVRPYTGQPLDAIFSYGWLGVEFFFIISGFVIFMTLEASKSLGEFAWQRFVRIWPGYVLSAVLIFYGMHLIGFGPYQKSLHDLFISPILWAPSLGGSYISGVYWSLVVEVKFYAIIAILYFGIGKRIFHQAWLILTIVATASHYLYMPIALHVLSAKYLPFFTFGIVFYRIWRGDTDCINIATFFVALSSYGFLWMNEGLAVHSIVICMLIIFWLFIKGRLNYLAHPVSKYFGRISYSLYLLHFEIGIAIMSLMNQAGVPLLLAAFPAIALVVIIATAQTLYWEEPIKVRLLGIYKVWVSGRLGHARS